MEQNKVMIFIGLGKWICSIPSKRRRPKNLPENHNRTEFIVEVRAKMWFNALLRSLVIQLNIRWPFVKAICFLNLYSYVTTQGWFDCLLIFGRKSKHVLGIGLEIYGCDRIISASPVRLVIEKITRCPWIQGFAESRRLRRPSIAYAPIPILTVRRR